MMNPDIIRGLLDPAPGFRCSNLRDPKQSLRYRVPLIHCPLMCVLTAQPAPDVGLKALSQLPEMETVRQLRELLGDGEGLGLLASEYLSSHTDGLSDPDHQRLAGSVLVFPPHEWPELMSDMRDWFTEEDEQEVFGDLPYGMADILPFAGVNFSPNRWFIVLQGPMAGRICWWTHDGDSVLAEPWATDIRGWGDRLWAELPDVLDGVIRFSAADSIDSVPEDAELFPESYAPNIVAAP